MKKLKLQKILFYLSFLIFVVFISILFNYKNSKEITPTTPKNQTLNSENLPLQVYFLDVGKADCAYINCDGKNILIDSGDKEPAGVVSEFLKKQNIEKLDLVAISHPHRDHIGQMLDIIKKFKIEKIIDSKTPKKLISGYTTYAKILNLISDKSILKKTVTPNDTFKIGDLHFEVFGPIKKDDSNLNNNSLVIKIAYKKVSFLFTGDAEKSEESDIIKSGKNLKSDVLKVGHHGSTTSNTYKFLKCVSPKYAVISGVPKEKIVTRLNSFCEKIYRTDKDGTVKAYSDGENINFKTEKSVA